MILELSLIGVSIVGMIILLAHKKIELSRGEIAPISAAREKTDPLLQNLHHTTGKFFSYFTLHNAILLLNYVVVHIVRLCMHASRKVHTVSSDIVDKASKKTEDLSRGGAASFYLKKIKETKDGVALQEGKRV